MQRLITPWCFPSIVRLSRQIVLVLSLSCLICICQSQHQGHWVVGQSAACCNCLQSFLLQRSRTGFVSKNQIWLIFRDAKRSKEINNDRAMDSSALCRDGLKREAASRRRRSNEIPDTKGPKHTQGEVLLQAKKERTDKRATRQQLVNSQ